MSSKRHESTRARRWTFAALLVLAHLFALTTATTALARPRAHGVSRGTQAQQYLHEGIAEYEQAKFDDAIADLRKAIALHFEPLAYYYLGRCYEGLGDTATAVTEYAAFVANAPKAMRPLRDVAVQRLAALRGLPASVQVSSTPAGAEIRVDGRGGFPPTPARLELTPGKHTIRVAAVHRIPEEREIDVAFGSQTSLAYDLKDEVSSEPAPLPAAPVKPRPVPLRPTIHAVRVTTPPDIDGVLNDAPWRATPPDVAFTQKAPFGGAQPTDRTKLWIAYDDRALYVAFDCEQANSPVVAMLARRDRPMETDSVTVAIDSRSEGRTAFEFTVGAGGVLIDGMRFDDGKISREWDEVWEAKTAVRRNGWSAEFRIPLGAIRFTSAEDAAWGFQARRYVSARQETDEWAYIPLEAGGEVSHYGVVEGLHRVESDHSLKLRPFVVGRARYQEPDPNILDNGWQLRPSAGLDFGWHPLDNLAVTGTINPDFGQVEADQLILNLTTVELLFPEKRPFFLAGMDDFATMSPIFYSRRIGRTPPTPPLSGNPRNRDRWYDYPEATPIYAAVKAATDLSGGWTLAALTALTGPNQLDVLTGGQRQSRLLDPLTSYNVLRARTELTKGLDLGVIATATTRGEPSPGWARWITSSGTYGPASAPAPDGSPGMQCPGGEVVHINARCFHDAYVGSMDLVWKSPSGDYAIRAQGHGTAISLGPTRTMPDGTHIGSGDLGAGGVLRLSKLGGEHWVLDGTASAQSRKVDYNDLGFMDRQNDLRAGLYAEYRTLRPTFGFIETHTSALAYGENNLNGLALGRGAMLMENVVLKSRWTLTLGGYGALARFDDREVGDGTALERSPVLGALEAVSTDPRSPFVVTAQGAEERLDDGYNLSAQLGFIWHPLPSAELSVLPMYTDNFGEPRYAGTGASPSDLVFGRLSAQSAGATLRASLTFLPTLTLQSYAQLFLATGHYFDFRHFTAPTNGSHAVVQLNELIAGAPPPVSPDFQRASLAVNVVLGWEYHLGSMLYLVYVRSQTPTVSLSPSQLPRLDPTFIRNAPATDLIMVKLSYWLG